MKRSLAIIGCLWGLWVLAGLPAATAQAEPPAVGFAVWVRAPRTSLQDLASTAAGAPQFAFGFRRERLALGLGIGLTVARSSDKQSFPTGERSERRLSGTAFQVGPAGLLDVWRSADGQVRGQIAAGLTIGRFSATDSDEFRDASGALTISESKTTGTLIGFHAAVGGEHYLHPHFALGVEAGFQGVVTLSVKESGTSARRGLGASGAYGALRVMVVW